jgi:hypothetical protein
VERTVTRTDPPHRPSEHGPLDAEDAATLQRVAEFFAAVDPVPAGLVDRVSFALELDDVEHEVALLAERMAGAGAARSDEEVRTVTFASDALTVTITATALGPQGNRIDGWVAPGAGVRVELRTPQGSLHTEADDVGRFEFSPVRPGRVQLVLQTVQNGGRPGKRVVTPAVEL